jgi:outer membrane lipoprotein SlyB
MRRLAAIVVVGIGLLMAPGNAQAASESTLTGVAIGAGTGALVAGPIGAVAGGVIGGVVGGPRISKRKDCWWDRRGTRHCRWR